MSPGRLGKDDHFGCNGVGKILCGGQFLPRKLRGSEGLSPEKTAAPPPIIRGKNGRAQEKKVAKNGSKGEKSLEKLRGRLQLPLPFLVAAVKNPKEDPSRDKWMPGTFEGR